MKKTVVILMTITIISKILGFLRDVALSYFYGTSNISDAYIISLTIPNTIFLFIAAGFSTIYIPTFTNVLKQDGEKEAQKYTSNVLNIFLTLCSVFIIISLLFTNQLVNVFASGFKQETVNLAVQFTRISLFSIYFTAILYILRSYLQTYNNYIIPALIGFPMNIIIVFSIYLSYNSSVLILSIGYVIGVASQVLLLIPFVFKNGFKYSLTFDITNKHIKKMAYVSLPVILGVSINQINVIVDRTLASNIIEGGVSALYYANILNGIVLGIFVISITTVLYPKISKMSSEKNVKQLSNIISKSMRIINIIVIPASFISIIFAEEIIRVLFGRGQFGEEAIMLTSQALIFYSVGLLGFGQREILTKVYFSLQDTKTPMINAAIAVIINIILNIILSKYMGISGLAFATSISATIGSILLLINLRKKVKNLNLKFFLISLLKTIFASLLAGLVGKIIYIYLILNTNATISLLIALSFVVIFYFILLYLLRVDEIIKLFTKSEIKKVFKR